MKYIFAIGLMVLCAAGYWYVTENSRKDREMAFQRLQAQREKSEAEEKERIENQRREDERARRERMEADEKENAIKMFLRYINSEEDRLKEEVEIAELSLQKIDIDYSSLEDELRAIKRAHENRVNNNKKRGANQRDMVERMRAMLKSVTLNRLAKTYCGIDLSVAQADFEAEMKKINDVDDKYQKRIANNLKKYDETVRGVDEEVDSRLKKARQKYAAVQKDMDPKRTERLQKQLSDVEKNIERIRVKQSKSKWDYKRMEELTALEITLQNQLAQYKDLTGLAGANVLHMEATEAETAARRAFDRAEKSLTMDNTAAAMERDHEQDVYNRVREFENKSVGKIIEAMNMRREIGAENLARAQKHLNYLKQKAVNVDFMNVNELEQLRKEIAKRISKSIIEVEAGK